MTSLTRDELERIKRDISEQTIAVIAISRDDAVALLRTIELLQAQNRSINDSYDRAEARLSNGLKSAVRLSRAINEHARAMSGLAGLPDEVVQANQGLYDLRRETDVPDVVAMEATIKTLEGERDMSSRKVFDLQHELAKARGRLSIIERRYDTTSKYITGVSTENVQLRRELKESQDLIKEMEEKLRAYQSLTNESVHQDNRQVVQGDFVSIQGDKYTSMVALAKDIEQLKIRVTELEEDDHDD